MLTHRAGPGPGHRSPLGLNRSRLQVGRRQPDTHPVHPPETAQCNSLARYSVLSADQGQRLRRYGSAMYRLPGPFGQHSPGILGLDRRHEDVAVPELEFGGVT